MRLPESAGLARNIATTLHAHSHTAYLVGGCVRDLLLGLDPKDYDVATSATPAQVAALFPDAELVGAHFGVVIVRREGLFAEVATFRSDNDYQDGRRPTSVTYETDPAKDALRRDFTINALFYDVQEDRILDFTGGRADLDARIIRAIGNPLDRFAEDYLRMLRAIRFAARFGYEIEPATLDAIRRLHAEIGVISAERIRDELNRILTEGGARRGFELLNETQLLDVLLPEVKAMQGVQQPPQFHPEGDVWTHTLMMLEGLRNPTVTQAWGVLLHDVAKPPTFTFTDRIRFNGHAELGAAMGREMLGRLRMSNDEVDQVHGLVLHHMKFKDVPKMKPSTLKRFLRQRHFEEHLELHRLDCLAGSGRLDNYELVREKLKEIAPADLRPPRLIDGGDLIALGYTQGPRFKQILTAVEDAQLEGTLNTHEAALAWVREHFPL